MTDIYTGQKDRQKEKTSRKIDINIPSEDVSDAVADGFRLVAVAAAAKSRDSLLKNWD